jgi:hypothetical protein
VTVPDPAQARAQMALWCIMAAPLLMGNDLRNLAPEMKGARIAQRSTCTYAMVQPSVCAAVCDAAVCSAMLCRHPHRARGGRSRPGTWKLPSPTLLLLLSPG